MVLPKVTNCPNTLSYLEKVFSDGIVQLREEKIIEKIRIGILAQTENETEKSWEAEFLPEDLERVAKKCGHPST